VSRILMREITYRECGTLRILFLIVVILEACAVISSQYPFGVTMWIPRVHFV
jgi:hypothetical protein